jgi:hypothetical protein
MDATMLPHVLAKLDVIREHQIKEGEALSEIRHLLRQSPAPLAAAPATVKEVVASKAGSWVENLISNMTPLTSLFLVLLKHAVAVGTIAWMVKNGQGDKALPYINWLLGM